MLIHELIEPLSLIMVERNNNLLFVISLVILLLRNKSIEFKEKTSTYFAYLAIIVYVTTNIFAVIIGNWTIQDFLHYICVIYLTLFVF